jgi:aspartate racemase
MKTIGVLGGLGPQATMDFEARVHATSQRLIAGRGNEGYPPMVVYYHRRPPVLTAADGSPVRPFQIDPRVLDAARWLGAWADFLVIMSNGVHRWQDEIAAAAGRPVLGMIDLVLEEVGRRGWRTVGVLTYHDPGVYREPLERRGLRCEVLSADGQARLDDVVPPFAAGRSGPEAGAVVGAAVDDLRGRTVDGVILGCTEFPLILGPAARAPDLIDPAPLLAEAAVRRAMA